MIEDPLTKDEHEKFLEYVERLYYQRYEDALKSGCIGHLEKGSYLLAKVVLVKVVEGFEPPASMKRVFNEIKNSI